MDIAATNPVLRESNDWVKVADPDDLIAETDGTRVFVAPEVAPALENSVLDTEETGGLILTPQRT